MERVVVTGIGVTSPLGCTVAQCWEGLVAGRSGVASLMGEGFGDLRTRIGAQLPDHDEHQYFEPREARRMSRASQMVLIAAEQAITRAGITSAAIDRKEVAVVAGTSSGRAQGRPGACDRGQRRAASRSLRSIAAPPMAASDY